MKPFFFFLTALTLLFANIRAQEKPKVLYSSLNPKSISEHLAFIYLYGNTEVGQTALRHLYGLLNLHCPALKEFAAPPLDQNLWLSLLCQDSQTEKVSFSDETLNQLEVLGSNLSNRKLKGYKAESEGICLNLPSHEIDLGRAVLLNSVEGSINEVRYYEILLDLMALEIQSGLKPEASPEEKIIAINSFVFDKMRFRFPPQSLQSMDRYTLLPSVMDSKKGVCLGVSILYLCLAQRLNLELEIITPPGHIYLRYTSPSQEINIETTARGVHLDSEDYFSPFLIDLERHTLKEVVGLAEINRGSFYLKSGRFQDALKAYQKAENYLPEYSPLHEMKGFTYALLGDRDRAIDELQKAKPSAYSLNRNTIADDYLFGRVNEEGLHLLCQDEDDTRDDLLAQKGKLENLLKRYPHFNSGYFIMAELYAKLDRPGEALEWLEKYHQLDNTQPMSSFYLSALSLERSQYEKAWNYFRQYEQLTKTLKPSKEVKMLKKALESASPS